MARVRTYRITFQGQPLDVDAIVEGDYPERVQVCNVSKPGERDPKTFPGPGAASEGAESKPVALGQWTPEERLKLFELIRIAHMRKQRLALNG